MFVAQSVRGQPFHVFFRSVPTVVSKIVLLVLRKMIQYPFVVMLLRKNARGSDRYVQRVPSRTTVVHIHTVRWKPISVYKYAIERHNDLI